jgi:CheY-like chemotaxis protein
MIDRGGHELIVTLLPDPVMLDADPTRLTQVFLNLLDNAAKYTEPGGHIRLSVERDGNEVVVNVRDTGIGITADYLPQIFDAFVQVDPTWQRTQGGLGVGLSLVKEFVGLHHGRVEVHSGGPGKGSEFIVRLPLAAASTSPEPPTAAVETSHSPQHRILVVDDNWDGAESLAEMLRLLGKEVNTAHDGLEAVEQAERFRPEVILMDIGMPKLNGLESTKRIREQTWGKAITVIALTGWGQQSDRERTREAGCDGHLVKPVKYDDLQKLLGELRGKRY